MPDKPVSDLRRRMLADMTIRSFSDKTKNDYIRQVEALAKFLERSPETATGDDLRRFQLHQVEQGVAAAEAEQPGLGPALFLHRHAWPRRYLPSAGSRKLSE